MEQAYEGVVRSVEQDGGRAVLRGKMAIAELAEFSKDHDVTVFCENSGELNRFGELLEHEVPGLRQKLKLAIVKSSMLPLRTIASQPHTSDGGGLAHWVR